jgi:hypothetical protein
VRIHAPFWQATEATLQRSGEAAHSEVRAHRVNGFEVEIEEAMRCIAAGQVESATMPHDETLAALELMDAMRALIGVRYPFE